MNSNQRYTTPDNFNIEVLIPYHKPTLAKGSAVNWEK